MISLEELNGYSPQEFARWLMARLKQQYVGTPEQRYRALDFRDMGVPVVESNLDSVKGLFEKLLPRAQRCFRSAVETLVCFAQTADISREIKEDLEMIAVLISIEELQAVAQRHSWQIDEAAWKVREAWKNHGLKSFEEGVEYLLRSPVSTP